MKRLLSFILVFIMIVLGGNSIFAESKYDFIEYDAATEVQKVISYDDMDFSDIPERTDPRFPRTRSVIGTDDREIVEDTTKFPYSAIVKIYSETSNGLTSNCSGGLISSDVVITAAHCIIEKKDGTNFIRKNFRAQPGMQNHVTPFGQAYGVKYYFSKKYYESYSGVTSSDIAIIKLDRNIGNESGWLGLEPNPDKNDLFTLSGYGIPDEYLYTMRTHTKTIPSTVWGLNSWNEDIVRYDHDSMGGNSGGAMHDSKYRVAIVHSSGSIDYNTGVRINEARFKMIYRLINPKTPVEKIELSPTEAEIDVNEKISLTTTITPNDATNKNVIYTSSNDAVATVSEIGEVTGIKPGRAIITVTSEDGNKIATTQIRVKSGSLYIRTMDNDNKLRCLSGAEYKLQDINGNIIRSGIVTDIFGTAVISGLGAGEYYLIQTKASEGYLINSVKNKINVVSNRTTDITIYNEQYGLITIINVDAYAPSVMLNGSKFKIEDKEGNIIKENLITNLDGTVTATHIPKGEYNIIQTAAKEGYRLDSRPRLIIVNKGVTTTIRISSRICNSNNCG